MTTQEKSKPNPPAPRRFVELVNEAHAHSLQGRVKEIRDCLYLALHHGPATSNLLNSLGAACFECNELDPAVAHTRAAVALDPENVQAQFQLGLLCLLLGHAAPGWEGFGWRGRLTPRPLPPAPAIPEWTGAPLGTRGILLLREQGFGDVIQTARYARRLTTAGANVVLDVHAPLRRLFAAQAGMGTVLDESMKAKVSTFSFMMELPRLFHEPPHGPGHGEPYIHVPADEAASKFGEKTPGELRIGIAWAGSNANGRDRYRSTPLAMWAPLLETPGCRFFSLLLKDREADITSLPRPQLLPSWADRITDFYDLALAIESLDLVISIDTAIVHLAGAMGKPVWTLVSTPADWRWGTQGEKSGWYPTMRLFRQPEPRNWGAVMESVQQALREHVAAARL